MIKDKFVKRTYRIFKSQDKIIKKRAKQFDVKENMVVRDMLDDAIMCDETNQDDETKS